MSILFLLSLLLPTMAMAAQQNAEAKLTYTERMGLYADWTIILLFILAVVAFAKFVMKK
ncbi:MAG: hypothetical protein O2967_02260 [Proteobacteria bacterium]|nr:hypothetical protein [Pseudomonadota bacterium]